MVIPPHVQKSMVEKHIDRAFNEAIFFMLRFQDQIKPRAVKRAMNEGLVEYGDASFHKTPGQLWNECIEEAADLCFYRSVRAAQAEGEIEEHLKAMEGQHGR